MAEGALLRPKMKEHASLNCLGRTRRNVVDSHATLIITNTYPLTGGTLKTRYFCQELMRSHFVVSLGEEDAAGKVRRWLGQFFAAEYPVPFVLNVAGPRESKARGIVIDDFFANLYSLAINWVIYLTLFH